MGDIKIDSTGAIIIDDTMMDTQNKKNIVKNNILNWVNNYADRFKYNLNNNYLNII